MECAWLGESTHMFDGLSFYCESRGLVFDYGWRVRGVNFHPNRSSIRGVNLKPNRSVKFLIFTKNKPKTVDKTNKTQRVRLRCKGGEAGEGGSKGRHIPTDSLTAVRGGGGGGGGVNTNIYSTGPVSYRDITAIASNGGNGGILLKYRM